MSLYGVDLSNEYTVELAMTVLKIFIICFPIIFTIGLLPQVNTFAIYLLEQIEINVFGGNGKYLKNIINLVKLFLLSFTFFFYFYITPIFSQLQLV